MGKRPILVLCSAALVAGCSVYGRGSVSDAAFASQVALGQDAVTVHDCPLFLKSNADSYSGKALCFSIHGIKIYVDAQNGYTNFWLWGPIPIFPTWTSSPSDPTHPLQILVGMPDPKGYNLNVCQPQLRAADGEVIKMIGIARTSEGKIVGLSSQDREMCMHSGQKVFILTFEKYVAPEREFLLTLHLVAPDGADVEVPSIRFTKGKLSWLDTIP